MPSIVQATKKLALRCNVDNQNETTIKFIKRTQKSELIRPGLLACCWRFTSPSAERHFCRVNVQLLWPEQARYV